MKNEECGSKMSIRIPDIPVDQWEAATCIQWHDDTPPPTGTIHDSGDGFRWMELDGFQDQAPLIVPSADLKMLREALCAAQIGMVTAVCERIEVLITEIDRHRPLGYDGKHGELHTPTCGCEDK